MRFRTLLSLSLSFYICACSASDNTSSNEPTADAEPSGANPTDAGTADTKGSDNPDSSDTATDPSEPTPSEPTVGSIATPDDPANCFENMTPTSSQGWGYVEILVFEGDGLTLEIAREPSDEGVALSGESIPYILVGLTIRFDDEQDDVCVLDRGSLEYDPILKHNEHEIARATQDGTTYEVEMLASDFRVWTDTVTAIGTNVWPSVMLTEQDCFAVPEQDPNVVWPCYNRATPWD